MGLIKYKLGELIELLGNTNNDLQYGIEDVRGVNNLKKMMSTKADLNGRNLGKFQIVYPGEFFFNHRTSRNGSKFSITYNYESNPIICTEDYVVFRLKKICENILLKEWLYMYFNRSEFDRFVITNSWGSSTEFYNWSDVCDIELHLPPLAIQQKYVNVYNAMVANQKAYERGLEDLKLTCDAYIEDLRRKYELQEIGSYIERIDERNKDNQLTNVKGLTVYKHFIDTKANLTNVSITNYKIVRVGDIGYVPTTNRNGDRLACGLCNEDCLISSIYEVIRPDNSKLRSDYLFLWFRRSEFDRYVRYCSWGSARETFDFRDMEEFSIPIPPLEIQNSIADIYKVYTERKDINEKLKAQIKAICPILIKGSIEDGSNSKEA
ncbi:hypothetical protein HMPREF9218_0032 [Lactobacillus iners LEAF 2062A-h1]|uniref:restriction endonuclease subunit S n=1 Tax=Lactobacillus iners TaxID=147802 RepID=UPI0001E9BB16|nr:restriction endonuclease subunit S [Lactobacillus iners]EFQ50462.1 hypothetical protein HMPREF9218_0032 [Lactobacillus iners LEAF 2062A-h1]